MAYASACSCCADCKLRKSSAIHVLLVVMVMIVAVCDGGSTAANVENSLCPLEDLGFFAGVPILVVVP
ncbi:hypothetical protein GOP47_0019505 [Adiantum capillus-veneris]|uniref:Uncharacterized protein n=1 Tax=Adiantum capillus-veneris TaxID=13818 RepID=A0A9D4Z8J1_ADICA|nr:hypothetical protein GOP47_0019505 [Adiantum capillus-veneris]